MGYSVVGLVPGHSVIEARYFGRVEREELVAAFVDILTLCAQENVWSVLADGSDLMWAAPLTDFKEVVDALAGMGVQDRFREAIVRPRDVEAAVSADFWVTAGTNRGLTMAVFRERDAALAWLVGEDTAAAQAG